MSSMQQIAVGPQTVQFSTFQIMVTAQRWLIADARKVPHYINGTKRHGTLDTPADLKQLARYHEAKEVLEARGEGWLLGFALGPDSSGKHWHGVDFDDVRQNQLAAPANEVPGYVEFSPSGEGAHAIGYGRAFATLGSNGSGIEAYAAGRYLTVTEHPIRDSGPVCLAAYVEQVLAPRHGAARTPSAGLVATVAVDAKTVSELRSALMHMPADGYDLWVNMGLALSELGATGRGLWLDWSATSEKFDPKQAARKWDTFRPTGTGYQAVFAEAQRQDWVNPASKAAQLSRNQPAAEADTSTVKLELAMSTDTTTVRLEYLVDPYLPRGCVVGFFGRGSTSKSSFLATIAAHISNKASTLWVSVEEPKDWIKVRHIRCGGGDKTLATVMAVASKRDAQGRVISSSFDIYQHLEPAIAAARAEFHHEQKPALKLVVLDTAVGLTGWAKGESPNDDAAVKKLLAYLQGLAEAHDLTIAIIGHANKGKHDHFADSVMGASAWTNSPRLSFLHAEDRRDEYTYVIKVAKTNLVSFGAPYRTVPVHTLYERQDGPDSVLVKVEPGQVVWGETASMELWKDATKVPRDDDEDGFVDRRKLTVADIVRNKLVEMVHAGQDAVITREQVETQLPEVKVNRVQWGKVDMELLQFPFLHKVEVTKGAGHNLMLYRPIPDEVPK